ncbi:amylo-alpha-1,6-glucosidase [Streptomyces coffeae]|uniref:Glycogen debranching protein n=1 Tax=Streptomyces coffeae TaxID=621382 RepID=A0ABS1NNW0_9ACTN|nr:glycogen debranching protein [Streptomyces coffeae]MBL1101763.1 glycogen debranching protein [Streptomyces coffeae]
MLTLDLVERPFTDRGSRLLVMARSDGLWIARAAYETELAETTVLTGLRIHGSSGEELPVTAASPTEVTFAGGVSLMFADPDTLVLAGSDARATWTTAVGESCALDLDGCHVLIGPAGGSWLEAEVRSAAEERWRLWADRLPPVRADLRERALMAWWTLHVNLLSIDGSEGVVPSKYGYVGLWNWDSVFHALALRHADPDLARAQLDAFLNHQLPDGQLPDVVHDRGVLAETSDLPRSDHERLAQHVGSARGAGLPTAPLPVPVTKPPLMAWAVWKIHQVSPDRAYLARVYPKLVAAQRWWFTGSDPDGDGLPEYLHPYSSGLDDSPVWDFGSSGALPCLASYLVVQYHCLAEIALALDFADQAAVWRAEATDLLARFIRLRWSGTRFTTVVGGRPVPVRTPMELMPLFTGRLPAEIAQRLHADLLSPEFWADRPVPTVAFTDPAFEPEAMWRGPVWLNVNYLLIEGLSRSGFPEAAADLRERTLSMVRDGGGLYEYWNPLTGRRAGRATPGFGWSSALFVDLACSAEAAP